MFDLEKLEDFHASIISTETSSGESLRFDTASKKPLHVYGRKSTAPRSQFVPRRRLEAFRQLLESTPFRESSRDSIHSSTPRAKSKRLLAQVDSPAVLAACEQTSEASSLSPSPSPPTVQSRAKLVHHEIKRVKLDNEIRGRQPLRLQATTSVMPQHVAKTGSTVSLAVKKGKTALRPITRKIPAKGIPLANPKPPTHKALDKVFSHARRLQAFGGSWPLRGKEAASEKIAEGAEVGDTTEIIEDYTIQVDASSSPPVHLGQQGAEAITSFQHFSRTSIPSRTMDQLRTDSGNVLEQPNLTPFLNMNIENENSPQQGLQDTTGVPAAEATVFFQHDATLQPLDLSGLPSGPHAPSSGPPRSTNLPIPPSPPTPQGNAFPLLRAATRNGEAHSALGESTLLSPPCAQTRVYQRNVPEISVTLPTSPTGSSHPVRPIFSGSPINNGQTEISVNNTPAALGQKQKNVSIILFLSMAFGFRDVSLISGQHVRHILPSRCLPRFCILSKPIIPSPVAEALVSDGSFFEGGIFGGGYLGAGRRGFWMLPLTGKQTSSQNYSVGLVLGLRETFPEAKLEVRPSPVVWTLQRLRYLLARVQDLARLGKFGVVTISTAGVEGAESIEISCQSSMALMMRTILSELACPLDKDGYEVSEVLEGNDIGSDHSMGGSKWLNVESGVRLLWWDEIDRHPILVA